MSDKRICKYCGMELSEDVPHGLRECHLHAVNRIADLEAEKCVLIDQQREVKNHLIDKNLHIDSLYEEGYKLQQRIDELEKALNIDTDLTIAGLRKELRDATTRIAELEKDNDEFRQLTHDWIIILTPDDGYVPDSECNDVATPIDVALRKRIAELEKDNTEFRQLIRDWSIVLEQNNGFWLWQVESVRQAMLEINRESEE